MPKLRNGGRQSGRCRNLWRREKRVSGGRRWKRFFIWIDVRRHSQLETKGHERLFAGSTGFHKAWTCRVCTFVSAKCRMGRRLRRGTDELVSQREILDVHSLGALFACKRGSLVAHYEANCRRHHGSGVPRTSQAI